jgi:hypothetical protein
VKLFHVSRNDETILPANEVISSAREDILKRTPVIAYARHFRPLALFAQEVPMTKHRTITGFVAVALLAVAATTANIRSHSHSTDLAIASVGSMMSIKELTADVNKLPIEDLDDQSLVYSTGTKR